MDGDSDVPLADFAHARRKCCVHAVLVAFFTNAIFCPHFYSLISTTPGLVPENI